tara:strand:- start:450 stop:1859 length:1410 start_codon:yes stop_codon:yes gene_type:complete
MENYYSYIDGEKQTSSSRKIIKLNPTNGKSISQIFEINEKELNKKLSKFRGYLDISFPVRSKIISVIIRNLKENKKEIIKSLMLETGRKKSDCIGEFDAAITCAEFFQGEGLRLYSNVRKSFDKDKVCFSVREPCGVALLIVASNTPLANLAWKFFPAFVSGNKIIIKGSEDVPKLNDLFYKLLIKSGVHKKEIMLIQGSGINIGNTLINSFEYDVISFTGGSEIGKKINETCSKKLKKISLELGGKNSIYIDCDCDIDNALKNVISSSFSNAGQRCASSSKIIIHKDLYEKFKKKLISEVNKLTVGNKESDFLGPVINEKLYKRQIEILRKYKDYIIVGNKNFNKKNNQGFKIFPTIIENSPKNKDLFYDELFGPIAILIKVKDISEAIKTSNDSVYGLTSAIHTRNIDKMKLFIKNIRSGVCNVNTGTHGSEPHFPFGGLKESGNGTREPGETAIDIYTNLKNISIK